MEKRWQRIKESLMTQTFDMDIETQWSEIVQMFIICLVYKS